MRLHEVTRALRRLSLSGCGCLNRCFESSSPIRPSRAVWRFHNEYKYARKELAAFLGAETEAEKDYVHRCEVREDDDPLPTPPLHEVADEATPIDEGACGEYCATCHPSWVAQRTATTQVTRDTSITRLRRKSFSKAEQGKHNVGPTLALDGQYLPFLRQRSVQASRPSMNYTRGESLHLSREHILRECGHRIVTQNPEPCALNCACPAAVDTAVQHTRICSICIADKIEDRYVTTRQLAEGFIGDAMAQTSTLDALLDPDQARHATHCHDLEDFRGYRDAEVRLYALAEPELKRQQIIRAAEVAYDTGRQMQREARSFRHDTPYTFGRALGRSVSEKRRSDYRGAFRTQEMASIKRHVEGSLERSRSYQEAKLRAARADEQLLHELP